MDAVNKDHRELNTRHVLKITGLALLGVLIGPAQVRPARAAEVNFRKAADKAIQAIGAEAPAALKAPVVAGPEIWKDPAAPLDARVRDLVRRLSLAEKMSQLDADAPAIPRLGIPAYSFRNECIHGVWAAVGKSTVFPEPIGMAATWDAALIHEEADAISTEARARFNDYTSKHDGNSLKHTGLSFYSPNINIVRDPRWGRNQETYGEDPFLMGQMAVAFIRGLQGDNPKYIKAMGCAKHFAVQSGPELGRHLFNAAPPERDLYDTYLPAFEAAVREGHVGSVMGAHNELDGIPCNANEFLLTKLLRQEWAFDGYVVTDGRSIWDIWANHKYVKTPEEAAAVAVKAGCDLFSGYYIIVPGSTEENLQVLDRVLQKNLLPEQQLDAAISRTLASRFRLGLFDPPSMVPWSKINLAQNDTLEHQGLALKVGQESIVLLKNNGLLPLERSKIRRIAVIGPNADVGPMLLGNYHGTPPHLVTILEGIKQVAGTGVEVTCAVGCPLALKNDDSNRPTPEMTAQAVATAKSADVVIYVGGLDSSLEREEGEVDYQGFLGGDRTRIELPAPQGDLLRALYATGKPVVFVNCSGSAIAMRWEARHLPAIVQAWYPGEEGGLAVGQVLFGQVDPAGRLPMTFYGSTKDLPPFDDYSMSNRTYRYYNGKPLFAFGHGLSYTRFRYADAKLDGGTFKPKDTIRVTFRLKNTGQHDGDEVAQVYFRKSPSTAGKPKLALCGFRRLALAKGESAKVTIDIPAERFRYWDPGQKQYAVEPGRYELLIGAASDDIRLRAPFVMAAE